MADNSKIYGYARVSSKEQNLDRQIKALVEVGVNERDILYDKQSGKNFDRPNYQTLRNHILRKGDTLIVKSLDRLGRNKEKIKDELKYFADNGIRVKILDLPTTMNDFPKEQSWILDMVNNILIEVLGTIAEQERLTTMQRQKEGYDAMPTNAQGKKYSRKTGKVVGRPRTQLPDNWVEVYNEWKKGNITAVSAMKTFNLKPATFYRLVQKYESKK